MAEPVTLSVLSAKFLEAVAAYTAQKITTAVAEQVAKVLFSHLATKDDLRKAIEELKKHIDTSFEEFRADDILVFLYMTDEIHERYSRDGYRKPEILGEADIALVKALASLRVVFDKGNGAAYKHTFLSVKYITSRMAITMLMKSRGMISEGEISHQLEAMLEMIRLIKGEWVYFEGARAIVEEIVEPPDHTPSIQRTERNGRYHVYGMVYRGPGARRKQQVYEGKKKEEAQRIAQMTANSLNEKIHDEIIKPLEDIEKDIENMKKNPMIMLNTA